MTAHQPCIDRSSIQRTTSEKGNSNGLRRSGGGEGRRKRCRAVCCRVVKRRRSPLIWEQDRGGVEVRPPLDSEAKGCGGQGRVVQMNETELRPPKRWVIPR